MLSLPLILYDDRVAKGKLTCNCTYVRTVSYLQQQQLHDMTSHAAVIDYFAILGQQKQPAGGGVPLVHTPLRSSFSDDPKETSTASDILNEAITDIAILPNGQCVCRQCVS